MVNDNNWFFNSLISFISIVDDSKSQNGRGGGKEIDPWKLFQIFVASLQIYNHAIDEIEREKAIDRGNNALFQPTMNGFHNCIVEFRESRVSHARMNRSEILCVAQFGFRDGGNGTVALLRLKNESSS